MNPKAPIHQLLKDFRTRYNLTQLSAARWCLLAPGTYRDYEQGRSDPVKIVAYAIRARIADYDAAYAQYMARKEAARQAKKQQRESGPFDDLPAVEPLAANT